MRALVMGESGKLTLVHDHPLPLPDPGEALIRTTMAGICSTDLEIARGYMGFGGVLGHEFVGVVEQAPDEPELVGQRVVGEINLPCRACPTCLAGRGNHCPHRRVLGIAHKDGAFADCLTLPIRNLHPIPDCVSDTAAVFTEPLAAAFRILEQVCFTPETKVAVLGAGRLGQLVARVLAVEGVDVTAIGRGRGKLDLLEKVSVKTALEGEITGAGLFDVVVDATGASVGLARAMALVRPCGTIILKTTVAAPANMGANQMVIDEITVIGSRCGPFDVALTALETGAIDPAPLITGAFALDEAEEAMRVAAMPGSIKVLLTI
ncbi:MAG: alcohol dehydrogenase catalytic domain-containing protein [Nitrospinota bacterium]|nr:alcohol dehydrogenase catalytic domain-containing protein [Nitrospinota bacterium]